MADPQLVLRRLAVGVISDLVQAQVRQVVDCWTLALWRPELIFLTVLSIHI